MYSMYKISRRLGGNATLHPQGTIDQMTGPTRPKNQDSIVNTRYDQKVPGILI